MDIELTQKEIVNDTPLTAYDRCDACGSQAYVRVMMYDTELLFCGHHFAKNEEQLRASSTHIHNEYYKIQPPLPANQDLDEEVE